MRYYSKGLEKLVIVFQVIVQVGGSIMNVTDLKAQMHMQEWAKLIETRQDSGLSIKAWCQQNNLPESRYYYYLKKLRLAACGSLPAESRDGSQFALVPNHARVSNPIVTSRSNIRITLSNAVVEIGEGADEAQVKFTLEVLLNAQ
jgi:hypothetical protein